MIYLLDRNQIFFHSVNKSEIHPVLSEIAKFIFLHILRTFRKNNSHFISFVLSKLNKHSTGLSHFKPCIFSGFNGLFIPCHFKKCGILRYTLRSKICVCACVRASVRLSVRQRFVSALYIEHFFERFSSSFV